MLDLLTRRVRSAIATLPADYWLLWLGTLVNRLGGFVSPFLALYLTGGRGVSVADAALVVGLFGAGSFAASLVGGELSDRLGRRPVMLLSFLVTPAFVMLVGLVQTLAVIAVSTLLLGFFTDLYRPAVSAAVADVVPAALRTRAYGYLYWVVNVGAAVAPAVGGLMARFSYLPLFIGDAATTLLFGLIVFWRIPESRPDDPVEHSAEGAPPASETVRGRAGEPKHPGRLAAIVRDPLLLSFAGLSLLSAMVYSQAYSTLPIDMGAHHAGASEYGGAIAVNGIVIVLLGIPASNSSVRWPRLAAMSISAVLFGIGFGLNAVFHLLPFYVLSVAIWTLGEIGSMTVAPGILAEMAPVRLRGLYQGIYTSSWGLAFFLGPALGGWVLQRFGSASLWISCMILSFSVSLGYVALRGPASKRIAYRGDSQLRPGPTVE